MTRKSRTVKKNGVIKFDGWRWQSDDLIPLYGRWVWVVEPEGVASTNTIVVEDKDGTHLAAAKRGERIA